MRILCSLILALALLLPSTSWAQLGGSAGYISQWFAPSEREIDTTRMDQTSLGISYTAARGKGSTSFWKFYVREANGDIGHFSVQIGWDLAEGTRFFIGPEVVYLDEGLIPGYAGETFALGLSGSFDVQATVFPDKNPLPIQFIFGYSQCTRSLELISDQAADTIFPQDTGGGVVTLGVQLNPEFLGKLCGG